MGPDPDGASVRTLPCQRDAPSLAQSQSVHLQSAPHEQLASAVPQGQLGPQVQG